MLPSVLRFANCLLVIFCAFWWQRKNQICHPHHWLTFSHTQCSIGTIIDWSQLVLEEHTLWCFQKLMVWILMHTRIIIQNTNKISLKFISNAWFVITCPPTYHPRITSQGILQPCWHRPVFYPIQLVRPLFSFLCKIIDSLPCVTEVTLSWVLSKLWNYHNRGDHHQAQQSHTTFSHTLSTISSNVLQ